MRHVKETGSRPRLSGRTGAGAVALGEALRAAIRGLGIDAKLMEQRALMLLPEVIDEITGLPDAMARPAEIHRGELVIWIRHDAMRHLLLLERLRIQAKLNDALGRDVVSSIRFGR